MSRLIIALVFLSLCFSCKNKRYSLHSLPDQYIIVGNFGGITGQSTKVALFPSGDRVKVQSLLTASQESDTTTLSSLKKKHFKRFMQTLTSESMLELDLNETGNLNRFVTFKSGEVENTFQWTDNDHAPKGLIDIYQNIIKTSDQ